MGSTLFIITLVLVTIDIFTSLHTIGHYEREGSGLCIGEGKGKKRKRKKEKKKKRKKEKEKRNKERKENGKEKGIENRIK